LERALTAAHALTSSAVPPVDVVSVALSGPAGEVAAATITLHGQLSPKPLYLVAEDAQYKLNVVEPRGLSNGGTTSNYRVRNDDPEPRTFNCADYGPYAIAPSPAERKVACGDSCHWLWFDGAAFFVDLIAADCDYNTWGVDLFIRGNRPVCNDP